MGWSEPTMRTAVRSLMLMLLLAAPLKAAEELSPMSLPAGYRSGA